MTERKYRMTWIDGDWFFLANDGETLCRVGSYEEDGSAEGVTGKFWTAWNFSGTVDEANAIADRSLDDFLNRWSERPFYAGPYWHEIACMVRTRREAIDVALAYADSHLVSPSSEQ